MAFMVDRLIFVFPFMAASKKGMTRKSWSLLSRRRQMNNLQPALLTLIAVFVALALWELLTTGHDLQTLLHEMSSFKVGHDLVSMSVLLPYPTRDGDGGGGALSLSVLCIMVWCHAL